MSEDPLDSYVEPTGRVFETYLATHPDARESLRLIAISCYGEIKRMGLPLNDATLVMVKDILNINMGGHSPETISQYKFFTGLAEHGDQVTPTQAAESAAFLQELVTQHGNGTGLEGEERTAHLESLSAKLMAAALDKSAHSAQGIDEDARAHFRDFVARTHLQTISEISAGAAGYALLDDECKFEIGEDLNDQDEIRHLLPEHERDQDPARFAVTMHIWGMTEHLAWGVQEQMSEFFRKDRAFGRLDNGLQSRILLQSISELSNE